MFHTLGLLEASTIYCFFSFSLLEIRSDYLCVVTQDMFVVKGSTSIINYFYSILKLVQLKIKPATPCSEDLTTS